MNEKVIDAQVPRQIPGCLPCSTQTLKPPICFLSGMEYGDAPAVPILLNKLVDPRKLVLREIQDILAELRVEFLLYPRHVVTDCTDPCCRPFEAQVQREIKKKNIRACFKTQWQGSLVIAVNYPAVRFQDFLKLLVKLLAGKRCPVRSMEKPIQVVQR